MSSTSISDKIDTFIAYKRSLGYVYDTQERYLKHYQKHMEEAYPHLALPDKEIQTVLLISSRGKPVDFTMPWHL